MPRLAVIDDVTWDGVPVTGPIVRDLLRDLLRALVVAGPAGSSDGALLEALWADPPGRNALQTVVSRARRALTAEALARTATGYRLALDAGEVDAWALTEAAHAAARALASADPDGVLAAARHVADIGARHEGGRDGEGTRAEPVGPAEPGAERRTEPGPAERELHARATADRSRLDTALGSVLLALGRDAEALEALERAHAVRPDDEDVAVPYLRALAAVHGPPRALAAYGALAARTADRLGVDPSAPLAVVHAELLAADRPLRTGVVQDPTPLIGRERELAAVRTALEEARVVTILGSGGLGKTTLAQRVARTARQPVVHVVALAAVTAPADVAPAVAAAIGARDGAAERHDQRADAGAVLARIAAHLAGPPVLLVLDNCEQVVEAVADLAAFLAAAVPGLRVLTTSRTPLAIGAERVVPLAALPEPEAAELLRRRVLAVRPTAATPPDAVAEIVRRLDGVPLALELAAAQARWLGLAEIAAALEDRFALLQDGRRDAPERHRTLEAVIAWSWDLLDDDARRTLAWLSAFRAPFGRDGAAAVLTRLENVPDGGARPSSAGPARAPVAVLARLTDHSLLTVVEEAGSVRYRMLETVREFAQLRLAEGHQTDAARRAVRDWLVTRIEAEASALGTAAEAAALARVLPELPEAVEVVRTAVLERDVETVLRLLPLLGQIWIARGDRARFALLVECGELVAEAVRTGGAAAVPSPLRDGAREVLAVALLFESFTRGDAGDALRAALDSLGGADSPRVRAWVEVALVPLDAELMPQASALLALATGPERETARLAWQWLTFVRENAGDITGAREAAEASLALSPAGSAPSTVVLVRSLLAQLLLQEGRPDEAERRAHDAIVSYRALQADEEIGQMRALLAQIELSRGDLAAAAALLARIAPAGDGADADQFARWVGAEVRIEQGDVRGGLAEFRAVLADVRSWLPDTVEADVWPWTIGALAALTTADARWGEASGAGIDPELERECLQVGRAVLSQPRLDRPVVGALLHAVGYVRLRSGRVDEDTVRLLVLARRMGQAGLAPALRNDEIDALLEAALPGVLAAVVRACEALDGAGVRAEVTALVTRLADAGA